MRHSQAEKVRSHDRIVGIAARRIREAGTEAPSVAEIMNAAGMTQGGFYKHFRSRDDLIAEAAERACDDGVRLLDSATAGVETPLDALVDTYLSTKHRDSPGSGCAVAALSGDAARPGNPAGAACTKQVRRYVARLQRLLGSDGSTANDRNRAITATSTLVGALILARAVDDPVFSDEILSAVRASFSTPSP